MVHRNSGYGVLFGGSHQTGYLNETWIWSGASWSLATPGASPPGRYQAAMTLDASGNPFLFGGFSGTNLGDTWIYNGTTWTKQTSTPACPWVAAAPDGPRRVG